MYPIGANGASQAILDAEELANALADTGGDIPRSLTLYEMRRLAPTAQVVLSNRAKGPERVLQLVNERIRGPEDTIADLITQEELDPLLWVTSGCRASTWRRFENAERSGPIQPLDDFCGSDCRR